MATTAPHEIDSTRAKTLQPVSSATIAATEQAEVWAADVMDRAFGATPASRLAKLACISETRVRHFRIAGMAFLRIMCAWAPRYPDAVRIVGQALIDRAEPGVHTSRPLVERMLQLSVELGHTASEIHQAQEDGHVADDERSRIRRELQHLIDAAYAAQRDLEVAR